MAKILEQASRVLAIVGGAMLAPVREGAANPFIPCSWNVPPGNNCNGLCPIGENCATIALPPIIPPTCVCAKKPPDAGGEE